MSRPNSSDFFPGFSYTKAPRLRAGGLLLRRIQQIRQILFSPRYASPEDLIQGTCEHYNLAEEVQFYDRYAQYGFHEGEQEAYDFTPQSSRDGKALVVGCGAGRECFALAKAGGFTSILGLDTSEAMIENAKKQNPYPFIEFKKGSIESLKTSFDLIWVTAILESHIPGRAKRIQFFKRLSQRARPQARMVLTPQIKPLTPRHPYYWSSLLLRLRWRGRNWEPGDTLLANLGAHHQVQNLVYSHFYPDENSLKRELNEGGWRNPTSLKQGSWVSTQNES